VLHPCGPGKKLYQRAESPQIEGNAGEKLDAWAAASCVEEGNVLAPQGLQLLGGGVTCRRNGVLTTRLLDVSSPAT
jgi:hypothetical protein